jgi:rsbT co-antagonist protein RsbR
MLTGLTRKVTLAAIVFLALIALVAAFVLLNTAAVQEATMHLSDEVLPLLDANGDFNTGMAQALGEIEAFAYSHDPIKLSEAQEFLGELKDTIARLDAIATPSDPRDDPDVSAATQQLLSRQTAVLEAAQRLAANLTTSNVAPAEQIVAQVDQLADELTAVEGESDTIVERHRTDATGVLATSEQSVLVGAGALAVLCVGLTLLALLVLRRGIVRPLITLADAAQNVAGGRLDQSVPVTGGDEIGTLQRSFNTMVATLGQQTQQLQQQVEAANSAWEAAEAARAELAEKLATIEEQRVVIREMSVPILPLSDRALVMPLIGILDTARLQLAQQRALQAIEQGGTRYALLDITGVPLVDTQVARGLLDIVQAARLLGAEVVMVGVRPEVAQSIVGLGLHLGDITVRSTLQDGILYALGLG